MHLELLVEEPSAEAALKCLVPKIVGPDHSARFITHQGKRHLLQKLPLLLRGYRHWVSAQIRIVVLIDEDGQDCHSIKAKLEQLALRAGLPTLSAPDALGQALLMNRLAVEELEAWFFGDVEALVSAYPRVPSTLAQRQPFRDPDRIRGGTWEQLEKTLQKHGYYRAGLPKIEAAGKIARRMVPERNRSHSFHVFVEGLRKLLG